MAPDALGWHRVSVSPRGLQCHIQSKIHPKLIWPTAENGEAPAANLSSTEATNLTSHIYSKTKIETKEHIIEFFAL